jgi:hypothetical protein
MNSAPHRDPHRRAESERRVRTFLETGGQWPEKQFNVTAPDPKVPYRLTVNDRRFLRALHIAAGE